MSETGAFANGLSCRIFGASLARKEACWHFWRSSRGLYCRIQIETGLRNWSSFLKSLAFSIRRCTTDKWFATIRKIVSFLSADFGRSPGFLKVLPSGRLDCTHLGIPLSCSPFISLSPYPSSLFFHFIFSFSRFLFYFIVLSPTSVTCLFSHVWKWKGSTACSRPSRLEQRKVRDADYLLHQSK